MKNNVAGYGANGFLLTIPADVAAKVAEAPLCRPVRTSGSKQKARTRLIAAPIFASNIDKPSGHE
jgi:hypothetical protein